VASSPGSSTASGARRAAARPSPNCSRTPGLPPSSASTTRIALGAYQAIQQAGLRIPEDISVVAFDDSVMAGWLQPGLSSVALPHYEMGRLATDLLIKDERHREVHLVEMPLRHRASIGPPAG
jgi:DNA-binding LacI/PurR family transcriptional regulator